MPVAADLQAVRRHYGYQQQVAQAAVRAAQLAWAKVTVGNLDVTWALVAPGLVSLVTAAQVAAARDADPYLAAVLAEQGQPDDPTGLVQPVAFAGYAADGRGLASLLAEPMIGLKTALRAGVAPGRALASGGSSLEMLAQTTVQDTGRASVSAGVIARPHLAGYVRSLRPPSCSRCAILAGRVYRWSTGFQRHPRCDCVMTPVADMAEAEAQTVDPMEAFRAGQVRGLSKAEEQAISDGADLNQVVNAHREGAYQGLTTAEGVTKRGVAGKRLQGGRRLTVAGIQRIASDRAEALRLLEQHGYLLTR